MKLLCFMETICYKLEQKEKLPDPVKDNLTAPSDLDWAHSPAFNKLMFYLPTVYTTKLPPDKRYVAAKL